MFYLVGLRITHIAGLFSDEKMLLVCGSVTLPSHRILDTLLPTHIIRKYRRNKMSWSKTD